MASVFWKVFFAWLAPRERANGVDLRADLRQPAPTLHCIPAVIKTRGVKRIEGRQTPPVMARPKVLVIPDVSARIPICNDRARE